MAISFPLKCVLQHTSPSPKACVCLSLLFWYDLVWFLQQYSYSENWNRRRAVGISRIQQRKEKRPSRTIKKGCIKKPFVRHGSEDYNSLLPDTETLYQPLLLFRRHKWNCPARTIISTSLNFPLLGTEGQQFENSSILLMLNQDLSVEAQHSKW